MLSHKALPERQGFFYMKKTEIPEQNSVGRQIIKTFFTQKRKS